MTKNTTDPPEVLPLGLSALIVRFGLTAREELTTAVRAFVADLHADPIVGVTHVAGSLATVLVEFDGGSDRRSMIAAALTERLASRSWLAAARPQPLRRWHVPIAFGGAFGPSLRQAATQADLSEAAAVRDICAHEVEVLTLGFAPGQGYLGFLPAHWDIPRMAALNPSVPAGALILAIRQVIIFTNENPTGWHHIGQSGFLPFDLNRPDPILLRAGDVLRFSPVSDSEMTDILADNPDGLGRARLEQLS